MPDPEESRRPQANMFGANFDENASDAPAETVTGLGSIGITPAALIVGNTAKISFESIYYQVPGTR
jgi:hypothetical protein